MISLIDSSRTKDLKDIDDSYFIELHFNRAFNASSSFGYASCFSSFLFVAIVTGFMVV